MRPLVGQVVGSGAGLVRMTIWLPLTERTCWATETFGLVKWNDTATGPSKPDPIDDHLGAAEVGAGARPHGGDLHLGAVLELLASRRR